MKEQWCIPPEKNAAFVCAMEDVLEVYHRPHNPKRRLVCFDEASKQQTKETRLPLSAQLGSVAKYDYEYEHNGSSNLFMFFAPLEAWRHLKVTDRRTIIDFAPVEARRIIEKLEIHYTPKHGSWLNMAEIEFSIL